MLVFHRYILHLIGMKRTVLNSLTRRKRGTVSWDGRFIRTRYDSTQRMEKSYLEVKTKENLATYYTNFILETAANHLGTNETSSFT